MLQQIMFLLLMFAGELYAMTSPTSRSTYTYSKSVSEESLNTIQESAESSDGIRESVELPGQVPSERPRDCLTPCVGRKLRTPTHESIEDEALGRPHFSAPCTPRGRSTRSSVGSASRCQSARCSESSIPQSVHLQIGVINEKLDYLQQQLSALHYVDIISGKAYRLDDLNKNSICLCNELNALKSSVADDIRLRGAVQNLDERFMEHVACCQGVMAAFLELHKDEQGNPLDHAQIHVQSAQQLRSLASSSKHFDDDIHTIQVGLEQCENKCDKFALKIDDLSNGLRAMVYVAVKEQIQPFALQLARLQSAVQKQQRPWWKRYVCCASQDQGDYEWVEKSPRSLQETTQKPLKSCLKKQE